MNLSKATAYSTPNVIRFFLIAFTIFFAIGGLTNTYAEAAQATLTWTAPTTYTDGTPITSMGGYRVYTGTTSGSYSQNIDVGNVTTYTMTTLNDSTNYYFAVTAYDTSGNTSGYSSQASFTTPAPTPSSALYTLTASAGSGGSITPSGSTVVSQGASQTFTIAANSGYKIAGVSVDGTSVGAVSTYTFSNVTANHSIAATFASTTVTSYAISATAGTGGSISPSGSATVSSGGSQAYSITAATGYMISDVKVDGASVGAVSTYTFSNVTANHTIAATFTASTGTSTSTSYTIKASAGYNGSISPTGTKTVASGGSASYTITPYRYYHIQDVKVDGVSIGAASTYTFSNVTANHTIAATFAKGTVTSAYTITATAGAGGSISPTGSVAENGGSSQLFNITPNNGYQIADVKVDGVSVGAISSYTFSNITGNHTIAASFASSVASYSISATAGAGGTILPSGTTSVLSGTNQSYLITPNTGYAIADVKVDGVSVGAVTNYVFNNVTANHTIAASFVATSLTLTASAGTGGSISPTGSLTVTKGASQSYTITPSSGYKIADVKVDGVSVGAVASYIFSNITANHTIAATFTASVSTSYSIKATAGYNGSISPTGTTTVTSGGSVKYTITPYPYGHSIKDVAVDGISVGAVSSYTFSNVNANHTISATFN